MGFNADFRFVFVISVAVAAWWAGPSTGQMEIDDVNIVSGPAYFDGNLVDLFIDPVVFGFEIAAVSFTSQSGLIVGLVEVENDEFVCDSIIPGEPCQNFNSLAEINTLGDLTFNFVGENGELDTIVVPASDYVPGVGQPGFPSIVSPPQGSTEIPPGDVFEWSTPFTWVEAIQVDLVDLATDSGIDEALFLGNSTTSWIPAGIVQGATYEFEVSFFDLLFVEDARATSNSRPYRLTSGYQAFNSKLVPEPAGFAVWLVSMGWLWAMAAGRSQYDSRGSHSTSEPIV